MKFINNISQYHATIGPVFPWGIFTTNLVDFRGDLRQIFIDFQAFLYQYFSTPLLYKSYLKNWWVKLNNQNVKFELYDSLLSHDTKKLKWKMPRRLALAHAVSHYDQI